MVKDGHWRADGEDAEKAAWEESVRLREQMFWSRIGGGVVPTGSGHAVHGNNSVGDSIPDKSPTISQGDSHSAVEEAVARDLDAEPDSGVKVEAPAHEANHDGIDRQDHEPAKISEQVVVPAQGSDVKDVKEPVVSSNRNSTQSLGSASGQGKDRHLSLHIP